MEQDEAIRRVLAERIRQTELWGPLHDETHTPAEWLMIITLYLGKAAGGYMDRDYSDYSNRLVQIAALALAALESVI